MSAASLDPGYWANVRKPRVDKRLTALDVHQTDRAPRRQFTGATGEPVIRRGRAARDRRALRRAFRHLASKGAPVAKLGFRGFAREFAAANQLTVQP